jgi:ATP-binding cassette subfamily B protein/subfamily B ATP-binding cassette protein MsbA
MRFRGPHHVHHHRASPPEGATAAGSHDRFQGLRRLTRLIFRDFIREKGLFGQKQVEEREQKEREAEKKGATAGAAGPAQEKKTKKSYLLRYLREYDDQKGRVALLLFAIMLSVALRAAQPWSSKLMIDFILPRRDLGLLLAGCALLFTVGLAQVTVSLVNDYTERTLSGNFTTRIKRVLMRHLQQLPLARLQELKVGGILSRLQGDTDSMADLLFSGLITPLQALLMLVVGIGSLLYLAWQVTLVCLAFCLAIVGLMWIYFNLMRPFQRLLREDGATIQGNITEVFSGIQVVRAFGRERSETRRYAGDTHLLWRKSLHAGGLSMAVHRSVWSLYWFLNVAIWAIGGYYTIRGVMSVGDLIAFIYFIEFLFNPIFMIMHSLSNVQRSLACTERTFDLLDEPPGMADLPGAASFPGFSGEIRFENVVFDYPDGTRALRGVNLVIPCGHVTALVGPSGAGKTTITNLAMRFYDVTTGRITVDDADIRGFRLTSYRKAISLVLQDVFLFDGTVRDNILYGSPEAAQEQIEDAARTAHAHEFITKLEKGYDTIIGERGVKLSGGQKQRVALARAVLTNPQLLILDEATSFLDSESEALVQDALRRIFRNRTTLVIAHRLSTIMDADKIAVIEKGLIVEEGTHGDLLDRQGRYYQMYTRQMEKAERHKAILDWNDEDANGGRGG